MTRFAVWIAAYGVALWLVDRLKGGAPGPLWLLFWLTLLIAVGYYLGRLVGYVRHHLLWRLRQRLIVAYIFIAVVPVLLILVLAGIGLYIVNAQFAAFLVNLNLRDHINELRQLSRAVSHEAYQARDPSPEAMLQRLHSFFVTELGPHAANYPSLEVTLRLGSEVRAFDLAGKPAGEIVAVPVWLEADEFAGVVADHGRVMLRTVAQGMTPHGVFVLVLSQPITPAFLDSLGEGIGPVGVGLIGSPENRASTDLAASGKGARTPAERDITSRNIPIPPAMNFLDYTVFGASTLDPIIWGGTEQAKVAEPILLFVTSRAFTLEGKLLSTLGRFSRIYSVAFVFVAIVFLALEIFALVVGIRLTRSITHTVDVLYEATERVRAGDFSHRINQPARDQLTALGEAFDSMTASVERLLRESQEKSRLESELEIAREVQRQLFPQTSPKVRGLELCGMCKPARSVSGDYYDFIRINEDRVGLVLGDIAGKGISAALLMAAIQSSLRAQVTDGFSQAGIQAATPICTSEVVKRLNRQLYESTSIEKYATFFYAVYDSCTRRMTYTNAGHLPPVLFRRNKIERLEEGGTVVGLFSPVEYEQAEVQIEPGDVFFAFTDGLTEPENIYGEEFGEERLLETVRRGLNGPLDALVDEVYRTVEEWTAGPEPQDDMTLILASSSA